MSNASGDPEGMKQTEPRLLFQMCAEKFVTQVCLTEQDFKTYHQLLKCY